MEEKILKTVVTMSIENIIKELRKFSPESLSCQIFIVTRPNEENTDEYYLDIGPKDPYADAFLKEHNAVKWEFNPREGEGIRDVIPIEERTKEDE